LVTKAAARLALGFLLGLSACGSDAPAPNFVFVTLDTTRADHLGLYGYFRDTSPALDAFGRRSIVFERCIVPMATTLPTHTSLFTATQPLEHGVLANSTQGGSRFVPSARLRSFAQVAGEAGWRTAGFVSSVVLGRGSGIESGFGQFDQPESEQRDAQATTDAALAWLEATPEVPFLLWVHYFDAHWPYAPPPSYREMFKTGPELEAWIAESRTPTTVLRPLANQTEQTRVSINLYDGELRFQDDQLARLLAALEARPDWERTLVVIAGDHGEGLGQHGEAAHGGTWEEQLHAPLLMRIPGEPPRRVAGLVTMVDVIPILLSRLPGSPFAALRPQASGRDVLAPGARSLSIFSQDTGRERPDTGHRWALTSDRWKLIRIEETDGRVRRELFDRSADRYELNDVSERHPEVVEPLSAALQIALDAQRSKGAQLHGGQPPATTPPDPKLLEQLRALGYAER
jgi:arylsulfatase A-like enzyme